MVPLPFAAMSMASHERQISGGTIEYELPVAAPQIPWIPYDPYET
jgi:hypothetical protein